MNSGDGLLLLWGTLLLYVPGLAVSLAARRLPFRVAVAGAPAVTLGLFYVLSLLTGATGLPFGLPTVLVGCVVLCAAVAALTGGWRQPVTFRRPQLRPVPVLSGLAVLVAIVLGLRTFSRGLGRLSVLPQEHDLIIHTQLVARIMRTGDAAPWQSYPGDLVSGQPAGFYPNGFHQFAALVGSLGADPVSALNAGTVVLLAVALPVGVAVLGTMLRPRTLAPLIGAAAALTAAVSYRPLIALMHDGGILANAAALAVAPGVIALLLAASRLPWARVVAPIALGMVGAVALHPSSLATIGVTVVVWLLADGLGSRAAGRVLTGRVRTLAVGAVAAGVLLVPLLVAASTLAGTVTGFTRDFPVSPLTDAIGITFGAPYGGFFDEDISLSQTWLVVLFAAGLVASLLARANAAFVAAAAVWATVLLGFLTGTGLLPVRLITGIYYNSYVRISGGLAIMQWLGAGIAIATAVWGVQRALALVRREWAPLRPVLTAVALVGLVLIVCLPYARLNGAILSERYADPEFVRVDQNDLAAARYVSDRIEPGQRVMNNANDGSTYGYVLYGLPLVESAALGSMSAPYTVRLLTGFDQLDDDARIRADVCRLDIRWVIADAEAPPIWAPEATYPWVPGGYLDVPPGLSDLDDTPHVALEKTFGDVSVYSVDLAALDCGEAAGE